MKCIVTCIRLLTPIITVEQRFIQYGKWSTCFPGLPKTTFPYVANTLTKGVRCDDMHYILATPLTEEFSSLCTKRALLTNEAPETSKLIDCSQPFIPFFTQWTSGSWVPTYSSVTPWFDPLKSSWLCHWVTVQLHETVTHQSKAKQCTCTLGVMLLC